MLWRVMKYLEMWQHLSPIYFYIIWNENTAINWAQLGGGDHIDIILFYLSSIFCSSSLEGRGLISLKCKACMSAPESVVVEWFLVFSLVCCYKWLLKWEYLMNELCSVNFLWGYIFYLKLLLFNEVIFLILGSSPSVLIRRWRGLIKFYHLLGLLSTDCSYLLNSYSYNLAKLLLVNLWMKFGGEWPNFPPTSLTAPSSSWILHIENPCYIV